jgi:hypothetical protein
MTKKLFLMAFVLVVAVSFVCNIRAADDDVEYECCCFLTCEWQFSIANPACLMSDCATTEGTVYTIYHNCFDSAPSAASYCESPDTADTFCKSTRKDVWEMVNMQKDELCPEAYFALTGSERYIPTDIYCIFQEKICSVMYLLGEDDPGLDILRQFRDEVLSASEAGRRITDIYYEYSDIIIEIFEENPALKSHAAKLLDNIIPVIHAALDSGSKIPLLTDEVSADASVLIDEIDAVMASPLKEALTTLENKIREEGLIE